MRNEYGDIVFTFGVNKGIKVIDKLSYLQWMLNGDFPRHTKYCIDKILSGELR